MSESSVEVPQAPVARSEPVPDAIGKLMEVWGFKRTLGRIWGLLYLSPRPISPSELCERLDISPASVSTTLGELEEWGVVRRLTKLHERRSYYLAESSPWKLVSRLIVERELRGLDQVIKSLESALSAYDAALDETNRDAGEAHYSMQRVAGLLRLAQMGRRMFASFVQGRKTDLDSMSSSPDLTPDSPSAEMLQIPRAVRG